MWRSYLIAGLRAMAGNRVYAAVNILGLALGVAAALLVFLYVRFETSYDRWLPDAERVVQLQSITNPPDAAPERTALAPRVSVEALRREFPEFEQVAGMMKSRTAIVHDGQPRFSIVHWSDPNIFEVLDLPFVRGDKKSALSELNSVVLTEAEAVRYFGSADPIGRTINVDRYGQDQPLKVAGVIADLPSATHLELQMIARLNPDREVPWFMTAWGAHAGYVYAKLKPGVSVDAVNARMPAFEARNITEGRAEAGNQSMDEFLDFRFAAVPDIHLHASPAGAMRPGGDPLAVKAFAIIAALILAIACVNFTNLTTARASLRAREVGVRKVLGASRGQLVAQFLAEATVLAGVAVLLGLTLVELALPFFNRLLGLQLGLDYLGTGGVLAPALVLTLVIGLVGGTYPAFYLSRCQPARVLGAGRTRVAAGSGRLRGALVIGQFAASIALIICAAVVYAQTVHARAADPGYRRDGLLVLKGVHPGLAATRAPLRRAVERLPGTVSASYAELVPGDAEVGTTSVRRKDAPTDEKIGFASVDYGWFETVGVRLIAGRTFSDRFAKDDASVDFIPTTPDEVELLGRGANVLLNETGARRLGFADPGAAVGAALSGELIEEGPVPLTVVGVVADARFGSLRDEVQPLMYRRFELGLGRMVIRFRAEDPAAYRAAVERIWRRLIPDVPFEGVFVTDELSKIYDADAVRAQVFALAALLAVAIACLGLFGLAAFAVERRRLEIAVRKVFGARDRDIARLMAWQFSRPVLLANLVAWPVAWWLMRDWLNGFASRIDLHAGWFVGAGALALAIALVTVVGQTLKASRTRPALALRYE